MTAPNPISVDYYSRHLCRLPNTYLGSWARYRINKTQDGVLQLNTRIGVTVVTVADDGLPDRSSRMIEEVRSCLPHIQNVYQRYGIQLTIDLERRNFQTGQYDHLVNLYDRVGRSDAENWYLNSTHICLTMLHEIGHLFSLNDEYQDRDCPDRIFISTELNPVSIMRIAFDFESSDFYPRHISAILRPACPAVMQSVR